VKCSRRIELFWIDKVVNGLSILEETKRRTKVPEFLISQLYHVVTFKLKKPKMKLDKGMLILSIDVDVGSKVLGVINKGKNDANVNKYFSEYTVGRIEEMALPLFVGLFENMSIPVTFAVRGQFVDVDNSIFKLLLDSSVKHDIGAHGYLHRRFKNLSHREAENELKMISASMKKFGIIPRSFVFPANSVAHLNLLEKYGYKCYRDHGDFIHDCMYIEKQGQLYNIHPSLYLDQSSSSLLSKKILDVAVGKKAPLHFWFHLWNLGETKESIQRSIDRVIFPMLRYAKERVDCGLLTLETMLSAAQKIESGLGS